MSKQIIIAAFPCCGKSYLLSHCEKNVKITGLDEDYHRSIVDYAKRLKDSSVADVLLVTAHDRAIDVLDKNKREYVLVYPEDTDECREEWYRRNKERKSIILGHRIKDLWKPILKKLKENDKAKAHYTLKSNEYLSDIIDHIVEEQSSTNE